MKKVIVPTIMSAKIQAKEGEWIEEKVRRVVENGEPIEDGAPIVYTERKDGVRPEYNIRTDRWEIAQEAMEAVREGKSKMIAMKIAKRDGKPEGTSQPDGDNTTGTELSQ
jgi:predicted GTPase